MSLDLAFDFGSSVTRLAGRDGALIFEEPTLAAVDEDTARLLAFGTSALDLGARCAGRVRLRELVRHGQLLDLDLAEQAISHVLERVGASRLNRPRVVVATHVDTTEIQRRALERALQRGGARHVRFVEQPIAAARAAGLSIDEPLGQMVLDVGGGTTDAAVLALGGIVHCVALPLGCEDLDEVLRERIARRDGIVIDWATAREIRAHLPTILPEEATGSLEVAGRDQASGAARAFVVGRRLLTEALDDLFNPVLDAAMNCITAAPPELSNDLLETGIVLAGGGSRLFGLQARLEEATGIPVSIAPEHGRLAVVGAALGFDSLDTRTPALAASDWR